MSLSLADHATTTYCPDCCIEHVCGYCHDTAILVGVQSGHTGTWVTATVCDCPAVGYLDPGLRPLLGTYLNELPEALRVHLETKP